MLPRRGGLLRRGAHRPGPHRPAHQLPAGHLHRLLASRGRGHQARGACRQPAQRLGVPDPHPHASGAWSTSPPPGTGGSSGSPSWRRATPPSRRWPSSARPRPNSSWITAAGAVLDTASLVVSCLEIEQTPQAQVTIRSGLPGPARHRHVLPPALRSRPGARRPHLHPTRRVRRPDGPAARGRAAAARPTSIWPGSDFAGWRVNYDQPLLRPVRPGRRPRPRRGRRTGSSTWARRARSGWADTRLAPLVGKPPGGHLRHRGAGRERLRSARRVAGSGSKPTLGAAPTTASSTSKYSRVWKPNIPAMRLVGTDWTRWL